MVGWSVSLVIKWVSLRIVLMGMTLLQQNHSNWNYPHDKKKSSLLHCLLIIFYLYISRISHAQITAVCKFLPVLMPVITSFSIIPPKILFAMANCQPCQKMIMQQQHQLLLLSAVLQTTDFNTHFIWNLTVGMFISLAESMNTFHKRPSHHSSTFSKCKVMANKIIKQCLQGHFN